MQRQNNSIDLSSNMHTPFLDVYDDVPNDSKGNFNRFYDNFLSDFYTVANTFTFTIDNNAKNASIASDGTSSN